MNDLQTKIFETVRQRAQNPRHWIDEVAGVLHKSKHAIYKKVQGETCLSLEEVVMLADHYGLHLDPLIRADTTMSFVSPQDDDACRYPSYLTSMHHELGRAVRVPDAHIWNTGIDLPFLHDCLCPELVMFRFFIRHQLKGPAKDTRFDPAEIMKDSSVVHLLRDILRKYYQIPATEIWNSLILDITLGQIKYALQSRMFAHAEDALILCSCLEKLITHLENMSECGTKFLTDERSGAEFQVFHNEIAPSFNACLLKSEGVDSLYLGFSIPQLLYTQDDVAIESTYRWLQTLRLHATPIIRESRKERVVFFSILRKKIDRTRLEIEMLIKLHELRER